MAIHNCHDFQALSALRRTDLCAAALAIAKVASLKHSSSASAPRSRSSLAMAEQSNHPPFIADRVPPSILR
jgi:hypothetical protein